MAVAHPTFRYIERDGTRVLEASGTWTVFSIRPLRRRRARASAPASQPKPGVIDVTRVERLDTAGILELLDLAGGGEGVELRAKDKAQADLFGVVRANEVATPPEPAVNWLTRWLGEIGHSLVDLYRQIVALCAFFGETLVVLAGAFLQPKRFRPSAIVQQMYEVWIKALAIVAVLCFLIGVVIAYQGVQQLRQFGAETFTVEAVGISIFRELGVLLTAIIVAGRSGSAFTAQLGTMQVNQEIDAMRTIGLNPIEWLVLPRIFALVISMPLLVFWGDLAGLLGGAVACTIYLDFTFVQFFARLRDTVGIWSFYTGLIKAPVFGMIIAAVGCFEGLQVRGSAESVGLLTTRSVVESIFSVIVLDAIFSIIFLLAGV
ncbi:MAG: ABC transporter permease [Proteobacteria bacterium]|nr:ABC transporter permease [Pseudomonadota bacterium]